MKNKFHVAITVTILIGVIILLGISMWKEILVDTITYLTLMIINIHTLLEMIEDK